MRSVSFRRWIRSKRMYMRIFLYFTMASALILILSTFVLYSLYSGTMIREIGNHSVSLLQKDAERTGFLLNWTLSYALRSSTDPLVLPYVRESKEDNYVNYEVWSRLKSLQSNHPYIDSIYLLNGYNHNILDTRTGSNPAEQFYDQDIFRILQSRETLMSQMMVPRVMKASIRGVAYHANLLTIIIPYDLGSSPSIFMMNIEADSLFSASGPAMKQAVGNVRLVNERNVVVSVSGSSPEPFLSDLGGDPSLDRMAGEKGWFTSSEGGKKQLTVYANVHFQGHTWKMIEQIPIGSINGQVYRLRNATMIIFAAIFLASVYLIWRLSRRIYSPIERLVGSVSRTFQDHGNEPFDPATDELLLLSNVFDRQNNRIVQLSEYWRNNRDDVKENFMKRLLTVDSRYTEEQFHRLLEEHAIDLPAANLQIAVFRIDGFMDFAERYAPSDQSLLRFAMCNIIKESMRGIPTETADMGGDHIAVVCHAEGRAGQVNERLRASQESIGRYLKLSVTVAVSSPAGSWLALHQAYKEASELSNERFKLGSGQFICSRPAAADPEEEYKYPEEIERRFLLHLRQEQPDETMIALQEFMSRILLYPYPECRLAVTHFIINLGKVLHRSRERPSESYDWGLSSIQEHLERLETIDAIQRWLHEMLTLYFRSAKETVYPARHKDLIEQIYQIVEHELSNPNLSTKWISDQIGLSVNYIRTMFKSATNISIIDFITNKRLENACGRLLASSGSIEEIAQESGFIALSSFYAAFKKRYGITPAQFRKEAGARER